MIRHAAGAGTLAAAAAMLFLAPAARVFPQNSKLQVAPHYVAGEVVRYAIETTTTTQSHRSGAVSDPQGPSALTLKWTAVVRTEVLSAPDAAAKAAGGLRMRTTFEKSAAESSSDSYDPSADAIEAQYREMEGKSFEYAMDASGRLTDVSGLEGVSMKQGTSDAMQEFLSEMTAAGGAPKEGISIGQTWSTERPVPASPLEGTVWKGQSSYLRNEPCEPAKAPGAPNPAGAETCAVLMTKLTLTTSRPAGRDATPENLKKMGMKTSGTWTGDGESLTYISLKTGRLVSVTQSSSEEMDFTMSSADTGSDMHYQGAVRSKMQMSLVPGSAPH